MQGKAGGFLGRIVAAGVIVSALASAALARGGAPNVVVNGVVRDGSGQGWPLYAKISIGATAGFPGATIFTDPATGYYSIALPSGAAYDFAVSAVSPGYVAGGGTVAVGPPLAPMVANWALAAAPTCNAPGYGPGSFTGPAALSESFDSGSLPPGWTIDTISGTSWMIFTGGDVCGQFDGNRTGGSGPYAVLDSACYSDGITPDDSFLVTPSFSLSGRSTAAIRFASDFVDMGFGATATVDVSGDGGTTWANVWQAPAPDLPGPSSPIADLSFAAGQADVKARFHYQGVWAWWWQVDDVFVGTFACATLPGGLVVGTVSDANTGAGLDGATVENVAGGAPTTTFATPDDPAQAHGLYILFSESGAEALSATAARYAARQKNATVVPNGATRVDFSLPAGLLDASPRPLSASVAPGGVADLPLNISNAGTADGSFAIQELAVVPPAPPASRPVRLADAAKRKAALKRIPFQRLNGSDRRDLPLPAGSPKDAPALAGAGSVLSSFPTNLLGGSGLGYETRAGRVWISNPEDPFDGHDGDGFAHAYLPDGTPTEDAIDMHGSGGSWQASIADDGRHATLWGINVGGDLCLFEMDPATRALTGNRLCGPWTSSQWAVAYDDATDTFYVGGPNDATVYHVDRSGNLIDSGYVGLTITGLAYNATTRHLFVLSQFAAPFDVWVADASNAYAILGGFRVLQDGAPALPSGGAGLAADCAGRLWTLDPSTQTVYSFGSGESGWCVDDIPWLSETPASGTVAAGGSLPVTVSFDSTGLLPGLRQGSLLLPSDTPSPVAPVPVDFTVLFADVPEGSFASNFVYGAAGAGVMPGCAPQTPSFTFCPADVVTRRSMAGFIERAMHGAATPPPVYLGEFADVLAGSFNANSIQGLVDDGVTAGCSLAPANYCPDVPVTRAQMAVFVWKARHGTEAPPACDGEFADVPCPDGFAVDYIEGIAAEGVTAGCGDGDYCPNASITNAQMAVFLVKAFSLPYLP